MDESEAARVDRLVDEAVAKARQLGVDLPQALFFRLADSMPHHIRERWAEELQTRPEAIPPGERRRRLETVLV